MTERKNTRRLDEWVNGKGVTSVIWTDLPPKFDGEDDRVPTMNEAVDYLRDLTGRPREAAEHYVRYTPRQIDTPYRRRFEAEFGWSPIDPV